jgi:hypothetical protein
MGCGRNVVSSTNLAGGLAHEQNLAAGGLGMGWGFVADCRLQTAAKCG